jgi:hypothetical protein
MYGINVSHACTSANHFFEVLDEVHCAMRVHEGEYGQASIATKMMMVPPNRCDPMSGQISVTIQVFEYPL